MIRVYKHLVVGTLDQFKSQRDIKRYLAACKEPCHRDALGYKDRAAPKESSEYLIAYREEGLILNLIDGPDPKYIDKRMMEHALTFLDYPDDTFLFCNQGESRSPAIAMMWLKSRGHIQADSFAELETQFTVLYPKYNPKSGIRLFAKSYLFPEEA